MAVTPQIQIETKEMLTVNDAASGIDKARKAPAKDIDAAIFPD